MSDGGCRGMVMMVVVRGWCKFNDIIDSNCVFVNEEEWRWFRIV